MNRIDKRFKTLKKSRKKAFIAFITAGYPDLATTAKLVLEFDRIGVDVIELGVPFSDPMADGPVIQEASQYALKKKVHLDSILKLVKSLRPKTQIPICLMTYYNPVFCFGEEKFVRAASAAGVDGLIVPDLPPEEAGPLIKSAGKSGLHIISFIAPTTSAKRAKYIAAHARGFIYYVSLTGVTGLRKTLPRGFTRQISFVKRLTSKPVCVGFGVSSPEHVKQIYKAADGAIVGSAIVRKIKDNLKNNNLVHQVAKFTEHLKNV